MVLHALYRRFFENIQIDETWLAIVREAATRGPVVYVLRNLSFLDFIALAHITKKHGLPEVRFANDLGLWVLEPFAETWAQALFPTLREKPESRLARVIENGGSAALFLKRPPTVLEKATRRARRHVSSEGDVLVRTLLDLQRRMEQPIMLIPQVFVWSKRPESLKPSMLDLVLGPHEWPGRLRVTTQFLLNYRHVLLRAGEPISLGDFMRDNAGESDETLVRRGTYALLRKVDRERRAVLGPFRKPEDRVRDEIIRSPRLQTTIRHLAGEGAAERMLLTARAHSILREMEALPDPETIRALSTALQGVLNRIYAGVDIDTDGIDRVRQAAQTGTLVLLPSHKSHMDYLLLSHVLLKNALQLPLVAAGDNLSFFPAGFVMRRGGAFFIRRSFKGDRLYVAVVDAYLRRLLRDGWPIEFFIEGTRSRTGKLLFPKLGLLNMLVEAALALPDRDVHFVPVSIGYERLLEERSYVRELLGAEKKKENTTALLRALSVLAEHYGRLNVQFGNIVSLRATARHLELPENGAPSPAQRRELTKYVAHNVMAEINAATAATPGAVVALSLLTHRRRGMTHVELVDRVSSLVSVLRQLGARMTASLAAPSGAFRSASVAEAVGMFRQAGQLQVHVIGEDLHEDRRRAPIPWDREDVMYSVPENRRLALDLSKNIIIHHFVPSSLVSIAIMAPPETPVTRSIVRERVQRLSRLFKYEFMFRVDATFEQIFVQTLDQMVARRELEVQGDDHIWFGDGHDNMDGRAWVSLYASMLGSFLEAYRVAARGLSLLVRGPMPMRDLVRRSLAIGDRMYMAGEIQRREALSRPCLENAFQSWLDQGYLHAEDDRKVGLAPSFRDSDAVRTIENQIANCLTDRIDQQT